MFDLIKRFGISTVVGFFVGVALALWVSPTTTHGFKVIVVVGVLLTIIIVEVARAFACKKGSSKDTSRETE